MEELNSPSISIVDFVLSYQVGLAVLAAVRVTAWVKRWLGWRAEHPWGERLVHACPVLFCAFVGLFPNWFPGELPERVLGGALLGAVATWLYGLLKRRVGADLGRLGASP